MMNCYLCKLFLKDANITKIIQFIQLILGVQYGLSERLMWFCYIPESDTKNEATKIANTHMEHTVYV